MCKITEDMRNEAAKEIVKRLIEKAQMLLQDLADGVLSLLIDELKKLEAEIIHLV